MKEIRISEMTWMEVEEALKTALAVILPLGSTEQHGYHLPTGTDNVVAEYMSFELAKRTNCLVLPVVAYGQVWSAKGFPGTIPLKERTFIELVKEIVISLEETGARNVIMFSGHFGNMNPCKIVARELLDEFGYENVYHLGYMEIKSTADGIMETPLWNGSGFHAGEIETSIVMKINKDMVRRESMEIEYPEIPGDIDIKPIHWKAFVKQGIFGDPTKATEEKGAKYIERWLTGLTELITTNIK